MIIDWNAIYAAAYPEVPPRERPPRPCTCNRGCDLGWGCRTDLGFAGALPDLTGLPRRGKASRGGRR